MKIKFNQPHLNHKAGDNITVTQEQGNYFILMKIADEVKEDKKKSK